MAKVGLKVQLRAITPDAQALCEEAARTCYNSNDKMVPGVPTKLLKACTKSDHLTINGHASATFVIEGLSRAASHQLVRHRHACFSQRSQRYVNEYDFDYVVPESLNSGSKHEFDLGMQHLNTIYTNLRQNGARAEDARAVLPNACATKLYMTMSFEGWLHFLRRRMDVKAQKEIRCLAMEIYRALNVEAPLIFNQETIEATNKPRIDWTEI